MSTTTITRVFFVAAICLGLTVPAAAQSIWTNSVQKDGIMLEARKSSMDAETSFATSSWMLTGYYSVTPDVQLMGELGFSHFGTSFELGEGTEDVSESTLSNLYLGAVHQTTPDLRVEAGVRVPLASDENPSAAFIGAFNDIDRLDAYFSDLWTINAVGDYRVAVDDDIYLRGRLGPSVFIDTFGEEAETDLYLRYAVQGWYKHEAFRAGLGLSGLTVMTGDYDDDVDRSMVAATASFAVPLGSVEPGLMFQLPVTSDLSDVVDNVVALTLTVPLR